jgi:hypothetical protein
MPLRGGPEIGPDAGAGATPDVLEAPVGTGHIAPARLLPGTLPQLAVLPFPLGARLPKLATTRA